MRSRRIDVDVGNVHTLVDGVDDPEQGAIRVIPGEDHQGTSRNHQHHVLNFEDVHRSQDHFEFHCLTGAALRASDTDTGQSSLGTPTM